MKTYTIEFTFDNNGRVRLSAKASSFLRALNQLLPQMDGQIVGVKKIEVISIK